MPRHYSQLILAAVPVIATLALPLQPARAAECKKPQVMIVLDKSSSMVDGGVKFNGQTKWDVAAAALMQVLTAYEKSIDFGLMVFPYPDQCNPGRVVADFAKNNLEKIQQELAVVPPLGGNWTPMAQSLEMVRTLSNFQSATRDRHVLLITDGWQWCQPYSAATRFLPVEAVKQLSAHGMVTHIVGFGNGVDVLALNKMAKMANTVVADSCDPASSDVSSEQNCYHQANNPTQLLAALERIAADISQQETCDGLDNNCDGRIDENLIGAACPKQLGVCHGAATMCGGTSGWQICTDETYANQAAANNHVYEAVETKCDGLDNDCDGQVDEGCGTCKPSDGPETCDGLDNNCDGIIDGPDALCANGGTCIDAVCQTATTAAAGCDCRVGSSDNRAFGVILMAMIAIAVAIRRAKK